jgi:hypothetical protein
MEKPMTTMRWIPLVMIIGGCYQASSRPFPMKNPIWRDDDLASVSVHCRRDASKKDPNHIACAPKDYETALYWDGADNLIFRPLSEALGIVQTGESVDVNSMDEVPDSAWFQNRVGKGWMTAEQVRDGACKPIDILDGDSAPDGSWLIDKGKTDGSTPGFRVVVPGKGKYMIKLEDQKDHPERQSAASAIGSAVYHAAGYYATCEQVIYFRPSVLKLTPGLDMRRNYFAPVEKLTPAALEKMLTASTHRGELVRAQASSWIKGHSIGPAKHQGTRADDPNDVVPHENRRELRGLRLIAAWLDRFDAREANSFDTWMADDPKRPDSSPGHVVHYQLDTSEALGGDWGALGVTSVSQRLGSSYVFDWGDTAEDLMSLGIPKRRWEDAHPVKGHELFGIYTIEGFDPTLWKEEYSNIAFRRMTERDAAWMARILARFTPEAVRELAALGNFTDPSNTTYLAHVMQVRLDRVLERYLLRLSPITDARVEPGDKLCAVDLAELRHMRDSSQFHYAASVGATPLSVTRRGDAELCVSLVHDPRFRYVVVALEDGVAKGKLLVHLFDLGPRDGGFKVLGVERL